MSTVWKRNLAMLWLSQLLVMAGYDALNPFVPLFMRDVLGLADAAQLAKYIAFYNISAFIGYGLSNPVWGWLGDRYGMKPMLLRGTFLTALFWPMMAYVSSPWTLILLRAITAVLAGTTAASQMMIARTAPLERQGFAQGTLTTAIWGGSMLGNVMGGLVIHYWNFTHAFWMCGILYFVAGISIFFTSDHGGQAVAPKRTVAARPRRLRLALPRVPAPVWGVIGLFVLMGLVRRVELPYISLRVAQLAEEGEAAYWTGFISAAVGLGAGKTFVSSLVEGGYMWVLYGAFITVVPMFLTALAARWILKLDFFKICGLLAGGTTDPALLSFSEQMYGSGRIAVNYATVYPLTMFLRVVAAQVMIMIML